MVCVTRPNAVLLSSGYIASRSRWMLFAYRRLTVSLMLNVIRGFLFVVFLLWCPLVLIVLVVVLSFTVLVFCYSILLVMSPVVLSSARSLSMVPLFVSCVSTPPIVILPVTFSLTVLWTQSTPLFLRFSVAISTLFLIVLSIALDPPQMTPLGKALLPLFACLIPAVSRTSGDTSIRQPLRSLGQSGTSLLPPALTSLVVRISGCPLCRPVMSFLVPFLFCVSIPSVTPPGPGLWKLNVSILNNEDYVRLNFGFLGSITKTTSRFYLSGGSWANSGSKSSPSTTAVVALKRNGLNVLSWFALLSTSNPKLISDVFLAWVPIAPLFLSLPNSILLLLKEPRFDPGLSGLKKASHLLPISSNSRRNVPLTVVSPR